VRKDIHAVDPSQQISAVNPNTSANRTDFLQSVDYKYNIRGWMTDVNNTANPGTDLFAMKLYYTDEFTQLGAEEQYNGNITAMSWKHSNSPLQTYAYRYDTLNQLEQARYAEGANYSTSLDRYTVQGLDYDFNGNILSVQNKGKIVNSYTTVDNLTYHYNYGNQLVAVDDAINDGANAYHFNPINAVEI